MPGVTISAGYGAGAGTAGAGSDAAPLSAEGTH
jgi:hypothetical protein